MYTFVGDIFENSKESPAATAAREKVSFYLLSEIEFPSTVTVTAAPDTDLFQPQPPLAATVTVHPKRNKRITVKILSLGRKTQLD